MHFWPMFGWTTVLVAIYLAIDHCLVMRFPRCGKFMYLLSRVVVILVPLILVIFGITGNWAAVGAMVLGIIIGFIIGALLGEAISYLILGHKAL